MIIDHTLDGELHCRFNSDGNCAEIHTIQSGGAMFTTYLNQNQLNEHIRTLRTISEGFDAGRHERDVQRWIDWAEENRGSPKLKAYIEAKAKEKLAAMVPNATTAIVDTPFGHSLRERKHDDVPDYTFVSEKRQGE